MITGEPFRGMALIFSTSMKAYSALLDLARDCWIRCQGHRIFCVHNLMVSGWLRTIRARDSISYIHAVWECWNFWYPQNYGTVLNVFHFQPDNQPMQNVVTTLIKLWENCSPKLPWCKSVNSHIGCWNIKWCYVYNIRIQHCDNIRAMSHVQCNKYNQLIMLLQGHYTTWCDICDLIITLPQCCILMLYTWHCHLTIQQPI